MQKKQLLFLIGGILVISFFIWIFVRNNSNSELKPGDIVEQNAMSIKRYQGTAEDGSTKYSLDTSLTPQRFQNEDGEWQEYDTRLVKSKGEYAYQLASSDHQAYFKERVGGGPIVSVQKDNSSLQMTPQSLYYTNDTGQRQLIADPDPNAAAITKENSITYKNVYGTGIDFRFTTTSTQVVKELVINSKEALPIPTIPDAYLELRMIVEKDERIAVTIPSEEGEKEWNEEFANISEGVLFKDQNDTLLYSFPPAVAKDSADLPNHLTSSTANQNSEEELLFSLTMDREPSTSNNIVASVSTPYSWLEKAQYPVMIDPTVNLQIVTGGNDGAWVPSASVEDLTATDMYIGNVSPYGSVHNFVRFTNVTVPHGATITDAYITVTADISTANNTVNALIRAQASDDASMPLDYEDLTGATRTTASTAWNSIPPFVIDTSYNTAGIENVVQEVVDRDGWSSGNAILFYIEDNGSSSNAHRRADTYEASPTDSPQLHVEFTEPPSPPTEWYDNAWNKRVKVTIQSSEIDANLTDFPVYVDLSDLPEDFHAHVNQTDARDIRVTTADGQTEVAREIVSYDASTDTGEMHFKAPSLSATSDTDFYIYYDNDAATEPASDATFGSENVWTNGFEAVWHLNESGNGTANEYRDSTANGRHGTGVASQYPDQTTGKLGNGQSFTAASSEYITAGNNPITGSNAFTLSAWAYSSTSFSQYRSAVSIGNFSGSQGAYVGQVAAAQSGTGNSWGGGWYGTNYGSGNTTLGSFVHVAMRFAGGSSGEANIFVNGSETLSHTFTPNLGSSNIEIGRVGSPYYFDGIVDEVRLVSEPRSDAWMSAEYTNQASPSTFYSLSEFETNNTLTLTNSWYSEEWLYRTPITVTNENRHPLANFQVQITIDTEALINADKMQNDCADIRITDTTGKMLPYWIEENNPGCNDEETLIWVNIPSIPTSGTTLYLYYGNESATAASNGDDTFVFFDDFNSAFDNTKWSSNGSVSQSGGNLHISTGAVYTNNTITSQPGYVNEAKAYWANNSGTYSGLQIANVPRGTNSNSGSYKLVYLMRNNGGGVNVAGFAADGTSTGYNVVSGTTQFTSSNNTDYILGQTITPSNIIFSQNRSLINAYSGTWSDPFYLWLGDFWGNATVSDIQDLSVDWVLTRKHAETQPNTSLGPEESNDEGSFPTLTPTPTPNLSGGPTNIRWIQVTIKASEIDQDLTDFPVYIDLSGLTPDFHKYVNQVDARDIRVTAADGTTELPREVVFYDADTDTGEMYFKAPTLSSETDTDFYIYYGDASANDYAFDDTYGAQNVWDSNYLAVYHLQEDPSGVNSDSTANGYHLNNNNNLVSGDSVSGRIGKGVRVGESTGDYLRAGTPINVPASSDFTFQLWLNVQSWGAGNPGLWRAGDYFNIFQGTTGMPWIRWGGPNILRPSSGYAISTASWHNLAYRVYNGASAHFLAEGDIKYSVAHTATTGNLSINSIGWQSGTNERVDGIYDEMRFSKTARSDAWLSAEHTNQSTPTSFYSISDAQDPTIPQSIQIRGNINIGPGTNISN